MHDPATEAEAPRPYWIPATIDFYALPQEVQAAIAAVINPAYRRLVLEASEELEQSTGLTIVYLLWLEIWDQIHLGAGVLHDQADLEAPNKREETIARYLRLVSAKNKTTGLLLRLREFKLRWGAFPKAEGPLSAMPRGFAGSEPGGAV